MGQMKELQLLQLQSNMWGTTVWLATGG